MKRYEYLILKLCDIPEEIIKEYSLRTIASPDRSVYAKVRKGMYRLPQAGLIANKLLEKQLNKEGYFQSTLVPGLWTHKTRPILFTLVVDDFGVKYTCKQDVHHLMGALKKNYEITDDWKGEKYIGITLDWDYERRQVHLSMLGYVKKALQQFNHIQPHRSARTCRISMCRSGTAQSNNMQRLELTPHQSAGQTKIHPAGLWEVPLLRQSGRQYYPHWNQRHSVSHQAKPTTDTLAKRK